MLDDPDKIESIDRITVPEIEVLYWNMEDSLSAGNKKEAETFFDMFCYIGKYRKELLIEGLKKSHIKRLKNISHELYGNNLTSEQSPITELLPIPPIDIPFEKEKDINDFLYNNPSVLQEAIGEQGIITGREVEIESFKCDIVFETETKLYAVELKKVQADHKAVAQLDKYCHYFFRRMRYNFFKEVQGICIANGFCCWSINEFRRRNHWIYYMVPSENGIKLRRII